jgi:hypothetical protein
MRTMDGRLRRRAVRSLVIQSVGTVAFLIAAVVLGTQGQIAGAVVFALLALVPLGAAAIYWRALRCGSFAAALNRPE